MEVKSRNSLLTPDPITSDRTFTLEDGQDLAQVPDGYVIHQAGRDRVHFLNPTAAIIYELCTANFSEREIDEFLKNAFDLPESPSRMVRDCLSSLLAEKLIRECGPSSSEP